MNLVIVLPAMFVLSSCADLHFRKNNVHSGLLEVGQEVARQNCKKTGNYQDSQSCINQVDANYDEAYK